MKHILITLGLALAALPVLSQDTLSRPEKAVLDKANLLTPDQETQIEQIAKQLMQARETSAYLLVVDSIPAGQNILAYTKGVFKKWELNQNGQGLAFLMVYSKKDKAIRVEASDLTLKVLTREYIQEVITRSIFPSLKLRKDFEGLKKGMDMLAKKIENN